VTPVGPVIGVVGHGYVVPRPFGELPVTGTPTCYLDGLRSVGARSVLLPDAGAADLLDLVDGLVLTGGGDVDPRRYGGDSEPAVDVDPARDDNEVALVRAAADAGIPLLGVCRGLQVLAVTFGGTLVPVVDHLRPQAGHDVTTAPGSLVRTVLGTRVHTSALHAQATADPGPCWRPTAWSHDGTVEAIEWATGGWPVIGVQWHPELAWADPVAHLDDATGPALFGWLHEAASIRAGGRGRRTLVRS
jgi:putative glutamine amidotransferase